MNARSTMADGSTAWQLVLADLALLLFMATLGGLMAVRGKGEAGLPQVETAPSQALFRSGDGTVTLSQWLKAQPQDPRATLTLFVHYTPQSRAKAWHEARRLEQEALASGHRTRIILRSASTDDIYASLAYDAPH